MGAFRGYRFLGAGHTDTCDHFHAPSFLQSTVRPSAYKRLINLRNHLRRCAFERSLITA